MIERLSEKTSNVTNEDDFGESWERLKDMVEVTKDIVEVMEHEHIITDKAGNVSKRLRCSIIYVYDERVIENFIRQTSLLSTVRSDKTYAAKSLSVDVSK